MKVINLGFIRCKLLECRISSIEDRIDKLHELNLFFQTRFDIDKSDKIKSKIEFLSKRKHDFMTIIYNINPEFSGNQGVYA
jgi:hypothetical protein